MRLRTLRSRSFFALLFVALSPVCAVIGISQLRAQSGHFSERRTPAVILEEMAANHGYRLSPGQSVRRVAPPFPPIRAEYWRTAHPRLSLHSGPAAATYSWDGKRLHEGDETAGPVRGGFPLGSVIDSIRGISNQQIEGRQDLVDTRLPGDWVYDPKIPDHVFARQFEAILRQELKLPIHLEFREVKRDVFVARGNYHFKPRPADPKETDAARRQRFDRLQVFGKTLEFRRGDGGGSGDLDECLRSVGRWIDVPIIDNATRRPTQPISWTFYVYDDQQPGAARAADSARDEDHDARSVLESVERQTGLCFSREYRPVKILFVERKE